MCVCVHTSAYRWAQTQRALHLSPVPPTLLSGLNFWGMEGKWAFLTLRSSSLPTKDESFGSFCFLIGVFLQIKKKEAILELRMDLPRVAQVFLQESWALGAGSDAL